MKIVTEGRIVESSIDTNSVPIADMFHVIGFMKGVPTGRFNFLTNTGESFEISAHGPNVFELAKVDARFKITIESVGPDPEAILADAKEAIGKGHRMEAIALIGEALKAMA